MNSSPPQCTFIEILPRGQSDMEQLHDGDPKLIGQYRVIALLGSGGMGRVYLCTSPGGRRLAVKVIRPELAEDAQFRARFRREVAAAQLVRIHVTAAVVDADTESRTPWLATIFLDGPTLSSAVEQSPLSEPGLRRLAAALAEALQFIHGAGLVHRDLKPSNIILAPDGPRVIDFGIARAADATALTTTNLHIGSPGYMAPEQIRADATGPESDIFALGAVLAYAATGRSPFGSGPTDVMLYRVLHEEPDLHGVPPSLRALVAACLAKDPGQRPTPDRILQTTTGNPATLVLTQSPPGEPTLPGEGQVPTRSVGVADTRLRTQVATQSADVPARRSRRRVATLILAAIAVLVTGTAWAAQPWRSSAPSSTAVASALTAHRSSAVPSPAASSSSASSPAVTANPLDAITVGGTVAAPTLRFSHKPLNVTTTTAKILTPGTGAELTKANAILFNYVLVNGNDGKQVESSFGKQAAGMDLSSASLLPGLGKGLTGQKIGSRLLLAIPPSDAFGAQGNAQAGFGATDTVVFLIDLVSASTPLTTATGVAVPPKAGLPTATVVGAQAAQVTVPKSAPPAKLVVQPLIKGAGPVVQSGQNIKVNYTGVLWNGKKFDASADHGSSFDTQIGAGKVITGWDKGLVGQTVGSRVLLVVPPAEGYGAKGSPPLIGPKDTLVFVVDILAIV